MSERIRKDNKAIVFISTKLHNDVDLLGLSVFRLYDTVLLFVFLDIAYEMGISLPNGK